MIKIKYIDLVVGALFILSKKGIRRVSYQEIKVYEKLIQQRAKKDNIEINIGYGREEYEDFLFETEGYIRVRKLDNGEDYVMLPSITTEDLRKFRNLLLVDAVVVMNDKEVVGALLKIADKEYDDYDKEMALEAIDEAYEKIKRLQEEIEIQKVKIKKIEEINGLEVKAKQYVIER